VWHEVETRNRDFDRESTFRCNVNVPVGQWASAKRHRPPPQNADSCEEELQKLGANIIPRVDRFGWFSQGEREFSSRISQLAERFSALLEKAITFVDLIIKYNWKINFSENKKKHCLFIMYSRFFVI